LEEVEIRSKALQREYFIKQLSREEKLAILNSGEID
jgi:predicted GIY-YIG superfamily endonuclease